MNQPFSQATIDEMEATLRYLKRTFDHCLRIDGIDMDHVDRALARIDIERSYGRHARIAEGDVRPALAQAAE